MSISLKQHITRNLISIPGWRTKRKLVIIESDDWGSIRMPSIEVYNKLIAQGIPVDKDPYCRFDSLESDDDLTALFEVLQKFKDQNGNHPVITANTIVANPDFVKIKKNNFREYSYNIFTDTYKLYPDHSNAFRIIKQGIESGMWMPQFHGREHLNVRFWMEALQNSNRELLIAFDEHTFGIPVKLFSSSRSNVMAAFEFTTKSHFEEIVGIIEDGLSIFNRLFSFNSETIIPPCYVLPKSLEERIMNLGIYGFQGINYLFEPVEGKLEYKKRFNFTGKREKINQKYIVRNAFFEPTLFPEINNIEETLKRMKISFFWNKPAVISSHRLNFIGSLHEGNRKANLAKLEMLLGEILKIWPDVEFVSTPYLLKQIS